MLCTDPRGPGGAISNLGLQVDVPFELAFDTATAGMMDRYVNPFWPLLRRFNLGTEKTMTTSLKVIKDFADKVRGTDTHGPP